MRTETDAGWPPTAHAEHVYDELTGWAWLWMTFGVLFWIAMLGGIVYVAVRFAQQRSRRI
jgi:hypothetical protein